MTVSWLDVACAEALVAEHDYTQDGPTFPAGCHAAVVEVDTETGAVRLLRFVAVDDCGTVVNPVVVAGQQQGGIVQGVAQALWEEIIYDVAGNNLTSTFADYGIPSAAELPSIEVATVDGASPVNALGEGHRTGRRHRIDGRRTRSSTRCRTSVSATSTCHARPSASGAILEA